MQSPNAVRPPPRSMLLFLAVAAMAACGEDHAPIGPPVTADLPARPQPSALPTGSASSSAPPPAVATIDVGGRVVDDLEQPIVGRPIVVVDASGKRFDLMTDEEG